MKWAYKVINNMDRKYFGIAIIVVSLLLLAAIFYVVFIYKFSPQIPAEVETEAPAVVETQPTPDSPAVFKAEPEKKISPKVVAEEDLKRMAASFSERFGSFSNQSNYSNIEDLKMFMTLNMQNWADNYVKEATSKRADASIYYGITTKAIAQTVKSFDEDAGNSGILVRTKRREATGAANNESFFYQDILINFVKENGAWKVDSAYWQAK